jgi:tRNA A-37 threonylcarbamoyl transferase component Bud32/dipeptidyl aminopeptidase/acylaminoacyl peptidase
MRELPADFLEALRDRYQIDRELGQGGMATVYLAVDLKHGRAVAFKLLRPELTAILGHDRFLREIRLTASLQHPHILPLLDSGSAGAHLYYVMPYVEGQSLRQRLTREGQLPVADAIRIARGVASALDYAHERGVIHRDVKPENILLFQGEPMVADFGIALAASSAGQERLTETGLSLGTPAYMSPEQASAEPRLDGRSDQYSLACVVYEMLAGEPPYTGPSAQAIIAKRLSEPIPHIGTLRKVSPGVAAALDRALSKSPADRFATAGEFAAALEKAPRPALLSPRRAALAGAAAALALVVVLAFLLRSRPPGDSQVQRQITFTGRAAEPKLSPDGKWLAYLAGWRSIVLQRVEGGEPIVLVPPARFIFFPHWTGDGTALVFWMFRDSTQLAATYMVPRTGGPARKVLEDIVPFDTGADSNVVVRVPREKHALEFASLQSGKVLRSISLPDSLGDVWQVAWSPNQRLIAFTGRDALWTVPVEGGHPARIAEGWNIRWSPQSDALYFLAGPRGTRTLSKISIDPQSGRGRGDISRVMSLPTAESFDIAGNGTLVYEQSNASAQARALQFSKTAPRTIIEDRMLTEGTGLVSGVTISPDGDSVAYSESRGGDERIYLVPFAGGAARPLGSLSGRELKPTWSPVGSRLAYTRVDSGRPSVLIKDLAGGESQRASSIPGPGGYGDAIGIALWSAGGKHLAYYSQNLRTAVLVDVDRQSEDLVRVPDSLGTGYVNVLPSPDGAELVLSTLVRHTDWGEIRLYNRSSRSWHRLQGPFGESAPVKWGSDGWIYLVNHRGLTTDYNVSRKELWRLRGPGGKPQLYAALPIGCSSRVDLSVDATRAVCVSERTQSDVYLVSNFDPDLPRIAAGDE